MIVLSVRSPQMGAATAWLGRLPEDANEQRLHELMVDYGAVESVTLRLKPGLRKSWALIAFEDRSALARLIAAPPVRHAPLVDPDHSRRVALARKVLGWSKRCKFAHAFLWEYS